MTEMMRIKNEDSLQRFIREVDGFHDALLHEAILSHPGYVDQNGRMFGETQLPNARLFFQSQFSDIALVEVSLRGVSRFRLESKYELKLEGEVDRGEIVLYLCGKRRSSLCELRSAEAEYHFLGREYLGSRYLFSEFERS